jgi:phosphohistidine phosphatase
LELILWRHAEAVDGVPDSSRELTGKGVRQAKKMARWLDSRLPKDRRILSSPAIRCRQTAGALGEYEETTGLAVGVTSRDVLDAAGWPAAVAATVLVGHQPTLGEVAALLLSGAEAEWSVKKGGIWWFSSRVRDGGLEVVLRAVLSADFA